ncbi:MAG: ABC transporter ATP-binding protein, partial [Clostridia bacterium]|nr:ABC transporter ATP-binding protein [Clostridia bacterium]
MASIRWLWKYAKHVKWGILLTTVITVCMYVSNISIISIQQIIVDDIIIAAAYDKLFSIIVIFTGVVSIHILTHVFGAYAYVGPTKRLNSKINDDLMRFIHRLPVQTFQKERVAKYVHYFSSDIQSISIFITTHLPYIFADIAAIIFLIYLIGSKSIFLVLIISVVSVLYVILVYYFQPQIQNMSKVVQDKKSEHLVVVEEGISSTREVLAFHQMPWEKKRYDEKFEGYFSTVMSQGRLINKQLFMSEPLKWGALLLVLGFGGYLVILDQLTLGMFVVLYGFSNRFIISFHSLFQQVMEISQNLGYVERIRRVMEKEQIKDGDISFKEDISEIVFEKVSFKYTGSLPNVLKDVMLTIPAGKKIAFVGTSGGGKSTIAQLLIRFYEPTTGKILINGIRLSDIRLKDWQQKIDIVFQDPFIFPDSIRTNITLGRHNISEEQIIETCRRAHIHDVITSLPNGYDTELGERGINLSGGQR